MNILLWAGISVFTTLLTSQKKNSGKRSRVKLLDFPDLLYVTNVGNGRMRLTIPVLKENRDVAEQLVNQLGSFSPISKVSCNLRLGSLLVCYNESEVTPAILQAAILRLLDLDSGIPEKAPSHLTTNIKQCFQTLNYAVSCKTNGFINLQGIISLLFVGTGIYQVSKLPKQLPNGYSLITWGMNYIMGSK